jgi:hypothetical protein
MIIKVVHEIIYINNLTMNYLTQYYKNLSEQLQVKLNQLQKELTEAQDPLYGARPFYRPYRWPGQWDGIPPGEPKPDWWDDFVRQWQELRPGYSSPHPGVNTNPSNPTWPNTPGWRSPMNPPGTFKPGTPLYRAPRPGQNDTIPDIFQQPTIPGGIPGVDPDVHGPPSNLSQRSMTSSSTNYY